MKFICPLIAVADIQKSRAFYEKVLGQSVKWDFGQNVTFHGDFAIHLQEHFLGLLENAAGKPTAAAKSNNFELYFETDALEPLRDRLANAGIEFIHDLREQPWGQRVMRFYDPDGHIVEVGEAMEAVVKRFLGAGMSPADAAQRTSMPLEFVEMVKNSRI